MPYAPNEDAAMYLIGEIMPIVWRSRPTTTLEIVGRDPRPRLLSAARRYPNVVVTGFVEDMRDHLERASVVAAPLRMGTGIQNKILEAMSMGVPVVTTPIGEAGLLRPGDMPPPIAVAADAADLAALLVTRLQVADRDPSPDQRARAWVRERFAWEDMVGRLEGVIGQASSARSVAAHRRASVGVR
jgi:glycosyltransferase involved in cell wall biosynthesis